MPPRQLIPAACVASLLAAGAASTATAAPAAAPAPPSAPLPAATDAERHGVYKAFRAEFDAAHFTTALPIAQRLVELTEQQYGADDRQLVNPLTNLGTVYYRLGDYPAAETAYLRAVRLIEGKLAGADRMLMRPLTGLGETYLATRQHAEAATALKRAVDLSRNLDGLFNVEQLDILDPLIESYVALDRLSAEGKPVRLPRRRVQATGATTCACSSRSTASRAGTNSSAATRPRAACTPAR